MKPSLLFLSLFAAFFYSCKKDNDSTNSGGAGSNKKLVKQSYTSNQFSGSLTFVYVADGKLAKLNQEGSSGGSTTRQGFSVSRNAAGMIEKIVYLDDGSPDSPTITVSSTGQRYTKAVESPTRFGSTRTTTTEFLYDNTGRIVKTQIKEKWRLFNETYDWMAAIACEAAESSLSLKSVFFSRSEYAVREDRLCSFR